MGFTVDAILSAQDVASNNPDIRKLFSTVIPHEISESIVKALQLGHENHRRLEEEV